MGRSFVSGILPKVLAGALFAVMLALGLLTVLRPWAEVRAPWIYRDLVPELVGVQVATDRPVLSVAEISSGRLQHAADIWVGEHLPQRPLLVRSFNEALWRSFGTSYMSGGQIVSGKQGTLFDVAYILNYCGVQKATNLGALPEFARRLRKAQDWFASRGQRFVYLLAPVKTTWFPDRLLSSIPCPEDQRDQDYRPIVATLGASGINLVDSRAVLEDQRDHAPVALFPLNGTHWNWLGAALAANALVDKVRALGLPDLPQLSYDVEVVPRELPGPDSFDLDIASLLNLLVTPRGAPSPVLHFHPPKEPPRCSLVAVNDSFMQQPAYLMQTWGVFSQVQTNAYFKLGRRNFPNWVAQMIDPDAPGAFADLFSADVVVLEEVESRVGGPFALMFLDLVEAEMARSAAPSAANAAPVRCRSALE
jgi:hypothetical protein